MKRWDELIKRLPKNTPMEGAEVGVYKGGMSSRLLNARRHLTLHMVDAWKGWKRGDPNSLSMASLPVCPQAQMDANYQQAQTAVMFAGNRANIIRGDSAAAADQFEDEGLDFVFIDARHDYEGCRRDIEAWWPKVKPCGFISGHDYDHPRWKDGVKVAVDNWLGTAPETGGDHTWFVTKAADPLYTIGSVVFGDSFFCRLAAAFERSIETNCHNAELVMVDGRKPEPYKHYSGKWTSNNYKLHIWQELVHDAERPLVLMDCDMIVLRDLWPAFEQNEFDVAITRRPGKNWLNGGVVFVNPTKKARRFIDRWVEWNDKFYADVNRLIVARRRHYGLNQTALVHMLDKEGPGDCKLLELPCNLWNNCDQTWKNFDRDTCYALHIKSELQRAVKSGMDIGKAPEHLREALKAFHEYDWYDGEGE